MLCHRTPSLPTTLLAFAACCAATSAQGRPIGFEETWALSLDRAKAVALLTPGTDDWFYYSCRERLDARDLAGVDSLLRDWLARRDRDGRVVEIENRAALLGFATAPDRTWDLLRQRLGLSWDHQRVVPGATSNLPTALDPAFLSPVHLTAQALAHHPNGVGGFTDAALPSLAAAALDDNQLRDLLHRLRRPDVDNLPALVVRDLAAPRNIGFGSHAVHGLLRLDQLEECLRLQPDLLREPAFVNAYLSRLQPSSDRDWRADPELRPAQFARLWAFVRRLAPSFNSLKAHVLGHWLQHDLTQGAPDRGRLLEFVRLPRRSHLAPERLRQRPASDDVVDGSAQFPTLLPPLGDDAPLLRRCFEHVFQREDTFDTWAEFLDAGWLRRVLAETKLLLGEGDLTRWQAMLGDGPRQELERRVELGFAATQRTRYAAGDAVALDVDVKHVPTLLLKVYAIDAFRYLSETGKEVDATIELDGVVPNHEQTFTYDEPPLHRVRRTFALPMVDAPGTWIVELVGNGISSRAVVHKGDLRAVERQTAAGHEFVVHDEAGQRLVDAHVWFGGRDYAPDAQGRVLLPFTTEPGDHRVVVHHGTRARLVEFAHAAESYSLTCGAHVEREALVAGTTAKLCVRPRLGLGAREITLDLLQDVVLTVTATDLDGVPSQQDFRAPKLGQERDLVVELQVPERLQTLALQLRGKVRDLTGKDVPLLAHAAHLPVNGVDATPLTASAQVLATAAGYVLEVRGKNGEPRAGRTCTLQFAMRDYVQPVTASLQTGADGRIALGPLPGVESVSFEVQGAGPGSLALPRPQHLLPTRLHGLAGETLRVPYRGTAREPTRAAFSLLAHGEDLFGRLALVDGWLELRDLPPGDHELVLHETGASIAVAITQGRREGGWLLGADRTLQAPSAAPLQLRQLEVAGDTLVVRVGNATPGTRVHIAATRALPTFDAFAALASIGTADGATLVPERAVSSYHSGRQLGDEYRYVLERRFRTKYPGNMLARPSLLQNPWAFDDNSWNAAVGIGGGAGGKFGGRQGGRGRSTSGAVRDGSGGSGAHAHPGRFTNLDWLPRGAATLHNLTPDAEGLVRVPLADLGLGHHVHVLVLDGDQAVQDSLVRPEQPVAPRPRELRQALDGALHFAERRHIEFVAAGAETTLPDARFATVEVYDSLTAVFRLLATACPDPEFATFAFLLAWPTTDEARKRELYGQHACHELHVFLWHKDRAFFDAVVKPLLADKHHKTFLDHWLLGGDLTRFLEPWAFARLNLIERVLLAQRLPAEPRAGIARSLREALELRPVDRAHLDRLFDLLLQSRALDASDAGDLLKLADEPAAKPGQAPGAPAAAAPSGPTTGGPADKVPPSLRAERKQAELAEGAKDDAAPAPEKESAFDSNAWNGNLGEEALRRGQVQQLYRAVEPTKRLVEHEYWHRRRDQATTDVVAPNRFWLDLALAPAGQPFVSTAFVEASGSLLEALLALAVLDLPFAAGAHAVTADGDRRTLKPATPLLLVREEIAPTAPAADRAALVLGENFFRLDDRYRFEGSERRDQFVTDEFVADVAYGCQVVVTNPTSQPRTAEVLLQIPAGALPVAKGFWTEGRTVTLAPYATTALEYAFYFPAAGDHAHYPAHATDRGALVAHATPRTLKVVTTPTRLDTASWEHVSQQGTAAEVLAFLDATNVQRLDLGRIAWRLREREFFAALLPKLRARNVFDRTLWSYALLHRDAAAAREYLRTQDGFLQQCGTALDSPLVTIDPEERVQWQHVEFAPLVHARAHRLGSQHVLGNADLARQYGDLLDWLGYRPRLTGRDWLLVTYHLLLQDRIEDALAAYARIDGSQLVERLQYDYLSAYLCFFTGDVAKARGIAERHREHAVPHWRQRFAEVLAQLDEAAGKTPARDAAAGTGDAAALAPALELTVDGKNLVVRHRNLARCELRYYPVDVEFAFSARPFADGDGTAMAFVQPAFAEARDLGAAGGETVFPLPERFHDRNVRIELRGAGLVRAESYFANALAVRFVEAYGQVAVNEPGTNAPLPRTYVKVFARLADGRVRFHKDGYTDLRGRFDYASLSDDPNAGAQRYAVLVLDERRGAVIREVAPPTK
jgi:hypothetical protein